MGKRFRTLQQTAYRLGVTDQTLREWIDAGEGPQVTWVRGQAKFHVDDVAQFVEDAERALAEGTSNYLSLTVG